MEKLFHPENPVMLFLGRVCDLMLLSVVFTLSCSTIVLSGAAVTALYSITLKMVRGEEGETGKGFFRALIGSYLQSVPGSALLFLDTALLMLVRSSPSGDIPAFLSYAFVFISIAAILLTAWLSWLFPLQARFENSFRRHSRNAAILAVSNCSHHYRVSVPVKVYCRRCCPGRSKGISDPVLTAVNRHSATPPGKAR